MANDYSQFTYDEATKLKAAGLLATTTNGPILDLGAGLFDGFVVIDMSACEVASGDEIYTVSLEGSNVAAMDSGAVALGKKVFGNLVVPMDAALSAAGRYVIPVRNEEGGTLFRYVRLHTLVAGTIATGINYVAFLAKRNI
jgi:hypothetical protein